MSINQIINIKSVKDVNIEIKMKVILLTGSTGSIGSKIVEYLSKNKIICVDKNLKELIKLKKKV